MKFSVAAAVVAAVVSLPLGALASAAPAARRTVVSAHAAEDESPIPVDRIAGLLFDLAKDPAKEFVFQQLGLATTASRIAALSAKIDALSAQLTLAESRLSAQISELALQGRLDYLQDAAADLRSMFRDYFIPVLASLVKVKTAQAHNPRDQAAVDAALKTYRTHKQQFLQYANSIKVTTLAEKIHNRLQPVAGGEGVLRQFGTLIMSKRRILTLRDSEAVISLYTYLEEYQALAAWMTVERAFAIGGASVKTVGPTLKEFFEWKGQQRNRDRPNGLLPPIPGGVAIDRGPNASTTTYTTKGRPMFVFSGTEYAYPYFDRWASPGPPLVQAAIAHANASKLKRFTGWAVPSKDQIGGLFSDLKKVDSVSIFHYLRGLFGGIGVGQWIWTSDTTTKLYCYETKKKGRTYQTCDKKTVHIGVSTSDLAGLPFPPAIGLEKPQQIFRRYLGSLFLVRTSDQAYL